MGALTASVVSVSLGVQRFEISSGKQLNVPALRILSVSQIENELLASLLVSHENKVRDLQRELAIKAPLNPLPFETALSLEAGGGNAGKARALAGATLSRQPRSLAARLYLFKLAADLTYYEELIAEYEILYALNTISRDTLSDAFFGVFDQAQDWSIVVEYLESTPETAASLLPIVIEKAWAKIDLSPVIDRYPRFQSKYLWKLIENNQIALAHEAWLHFEGLTLDDLSSIPFNYQLQERSEGEPFNWSLNSEVAEYLSGGGIYINYRGRDRTVIARQIVDLEEGVYLLRAEAGGRMTKRGGNLSLSLECALDRELLAELEVALERFDELEFFQTEVSIGAEECDFQQLILRGVPGAFPETAKITVQSIQFLKSVEFND